MKKIFFSIIATLCAFAAVSCQKGDGDAEYGNAVVYIAQAMTNGAIDNVCAVPAGADVYTYNFKVEENVVKVFLSVYRSGKLDASEVTVNIAADATESAAQAAAMGAKVMPESMYSLPLKATVPAGQNGATVYLELQKSALQSASGVYVLCVGISNPSKYELNEAASSVVVKLDADAMKAFI